MGIYIAHTYTQIPVCIIHLQIKGGREEDKIELLKN
jgi:hypothetical protein